MDYYEILEIDKNASTSEIKKHYYKLAKKYHPDKHNGNISYCEKFKSLSEAYTVLSNPKKRYLYDMKINYDIDSEYYFKFTEEDYELLHSYYEKVMNSTEIKFIKKLYKSLPENIKIKMKDKFTKNKYSENGKCYEIISEKKKIIDASKIVDNYDINLCLKFKDIYENKSKQIKIITKNKCYYLFITNHNYRIKIKIDKIFLKINIFGDLKGLIVKNYDLIIEKELNLYQYYYGDYFSIKLGDTDIMVKNNKNETHNIKFLGLKNPSTMQRGDLYILFKLNLDNHKLKTEEDKKLIKSLFD